MSTPRLLEWSHASGWKDGYIVLVDRDDPHVVRFVDTNRVELPLVDEIDRVEQVAVVAVRGNIDEAIEKGPLSEWSEPVMVPEPASSVALAIALMSLWGLQKFGWPKTAVDFALHSLVGLIVASVSAYFGAPGWMPTVLAVTHGIFREWGQWHSSGEPNLLDRFVDVLGYIPGGIIGQLFGGAAIEAEIWAFGQLL